MDSHVRERESLVPSRRQALCLGAALVTVPTGILALAVPTPSLASTLAAPAPAHPCSAPVPRGWPSPPPWMNWRRQAMAGCWRVLGCGGRRMGARPRPGSMPAA